MLDRQTVRRLLWLRYSYTATSSGLTTMHFRSVVVGPTAYASMWWVGEYAVDGVYRWLHVGRFAVGVGPEFGMSEALEEGARARWLWGGPHGLVLVLNPPTEGR